MKKAPESTQRSALREGIESGTTAFFEPLMYIVKLIRHLVRR